MAYAMRVMLIANVEVKNLNPRSGGKVSIPVLKKALLMWIVAMKRTIFETVPRFNLLAKEDPKKNMPKPAPNPYGLKPTPNLNTMIAFPTKVPMHAAPIAMIPESPTA